VNERDLFPVWALATLVAVAVLTALGALLLSSGGEPGGGLDDAVTPGTYSRSAIGHAGVARLLDRAGIQVTRSPLRPRQRRPPSSLVVIAEPRLVAGAEAEIRPLIATGAALLVLPKWTGRPSTDRPGWIDDAELLSAGEAERVLRLVNGEARLVRSKDRAKWTENKLGPAPAPAAPVQLAQGGDLRPIVAAADGILVGEIRRGRWPLWVLTDPDVIANHGLGRDGNAEFALALFDGLRASTGSIVFIETVRGSAADRANPARLLFQRPLVFFTAQTLLAALLLLWAATARFGAAEAAPAALQAGRQRLLRNTAELLEYAGYEATIVARYVETTIRYVAGQLRAPRGLSETATIAWLERVGRARGVTIDCAELAQTAARLRAGRRSDRKAVAKLARDANRWKREIIDGSGEHSRRH
jgi:hypothetical protein